ncbi:hypothetical protein ACGFR6_12695 [Streptomyces sp. NPDC048567]
MGELLAGCASDQLAFLFDCFARASEAYRAAAEQLRDGGADA